eukprot:TRINITY_DN85343_c0_g1_i1.p1 TRINITY_DN85343_c0_g1~~TRINITY_DN85343_c0_g1_i1.p1  ORF type:complete len:181 (+),score=12.76 TRINITY_DN85343_c0_g1_i1:33-575(+)
MNFENSSKLPGITITPYQTETCSSELNQFNTQNSQQIRWTEESTQKTIHANKPFQRTTGQEESFVFHVRLPVKKAKIAIGVMQAPCEQYLAPRVGAVSVSYCSYGGAGFLHPTEEQTGLPYKEGDVVSVEVNLNDNAQRVTFKTNGKTAGSCLWPHPVAWPAISVDGGAEVLAEVHWGSK